MNIYNYYLLILMMLPFTAVHAVRIPHYKGYRLVWHDEFNRDGRLDSTSWNYETGFQRNEEDQWYQYDNAFCQNGNLVIEARREHRPNPDYGKTADWRNRQYISYTSASVNTRGKRSFTYGRFEVRARIPAFMGCWPAIWLLGQNDGGDLSWPHCGEIDVMEFYHVKGSPTILANACWGSDSAKFRPVWNTVRTPYSHFLAKDPQWGSKFHVWRMDWTPDSIRIYLDGELLNGIALSETVDARSTFFHRVDYNPFHHPQYLLLNLALGGINGGDLEHTPLPCRYEIDYVRVYQKKQALLQ